VDIGGGSVELIVGTADEVFLTSSEPVGACGCRDVHARPRSAPAMIDECRAYVTKRLKKPLARISALGSIFRRHFGHDRRPGHARVADLERVETMSSGLKWLSRKRCARSSTR
jgi:exopolyphosphatase/pppGpp-phosphohydrolase